MFDGLISILDIVEKMINKLEDISIETPQIKKKGEKNGKKRTEYPKSVWQLQNM